MNHQRRLALFSGVLAAGLFCGFVICANATQQVSDDAFLEDVSQKSFLYFMELQHPQTGLVLDRGRNDVPDGTRSDWDYAPASTATTGFGLSALVVGAERGWISRDEAYQRCLTTLKFFRDRMASKWGFYYHFVDARDGKRMWDSELSTIDTVLFLAGALTAAEYFKGTEVDTIARALFERADWSAMLSPSGEFISMGWKPEGGLLKADWNSYCEHMLLYLMAIGSPTHPVSADLWHTWKRPVGEYADHVCIAQGPLFTHQYSHIWIDFRNKHDRYADYFENSRQATLANRTFTIRLKSKFKTYDENVWGLTASDGPNGYKAYGAPPAQPIHDGTIAPTAAGGSIVFTPELSIRCLRTIRERYGDRLWGRYGFSDAFNVDRDWWDKDVIGIDQGTILLMIENFRSGLVWDLFMRQAWVSRAMETAGFESGMKILTAADVTLERVKVKNVDDRPILQVRRVRHLPVADGDLSDWGPNTEHLPWTQLLYPDDVETGRRSGPDDLGAKFSVVRADEGIALAVLVDDHDVTNANAAPDLYKGDLVEVYVDPEDNLLAWGSAADYQIGVAPESAKAGGDTGMDWYAWFQNGRPNGISAAAKKHAGGYAAEVVLKWSEMGVAKNPHSIGFSVAVHDVDRDSTPECKLQWFFLDPGIVLGRLLLSDPDTGLIADFNSGARMNNAGGEIGAWNKDPKDMTQGAWIDFVRDAPNLSMYLALRYDVGSPRPAYNGLWMKLNRFDATPFGALVFRVRGDPDAGIPKKIKIELKTERAGVAAVYVERLTPDWQSIRLPKSKFKSITDWSALSELVVTFEDVTAGVKTGRIHLDDIRFE